MSEGENQMASNRSMLRDFVSSIAVMRGDLSNITAPPFVLDTKSTVELPSFWAENPSVFCAPANEEDPAKRAMLVLRWYLSSLRNQNYMGHSEDHGVKKPLNAFLGELFVGKWEDNMGTTRLVSEQVSHHPPITACRVWNEDYGVAAEGYTRQTITFNGNVCIAQTGHALFTLSKRDESYLIPLPTLRIKGVLTGTPYPELGGKYYIPSTSGYMSVVEFTGKSLFGGNSKHSLKAKVYHEDEGEDSPVYTIEGTWNEKFVIHDVQQEADVETFDIVEQASKVTKLQVDPVDEQDPWESRRAWKGVIDALNRGDMQGVADAKSEVEQGQRNMRKDEQIEGNTDWQQTFFQCKDTAPVASVLMPKIPGQRATLETEAKETRGVWVFDQERWNRGIPKPYRGDIMPNNSHAPSGFLKPAASTTSSPRASIDSTRSPRTSTDLRPSRESIEANGAASPVRKLSTMEPEQSARRGSWGSLASSIRSAFSSPASSQVSLDQPSQTRKSMDSLSRPSQASLSGHSPINSPRNSSVFARSSLSQAPMQSDAVRASHDKISSPQTAPKGGSDMATVESGVAGMSMEEKTAVESMLRDTFASKRKSVV